VVAVNVAITQLLEAHRSRDRRLPAAVALLFCAAWAYGAEALARPPTSGEPMTAAVAHYQKRGDYSLSDYAALGLDRGYAPLIQEALRAKPALLVLPESVVLGAVTLDDTHSRAKPKAYETPIGRWDAEAKRSLAGTPTILVIGMDTVEGGEDHNTLVAWEAGGRLGTYHKRVLVWFAESAPPGWPRGPLRGRTDYAPGAGSQLIRAGALVLGGFICQEVVHPALFRESVRDGATVLVSGAQDGVFADSAVAAVQADLAQLRAVETGRYFVRAVKDGVSAIIDPFGFELARSGADEAGILTAAIRPLSGLTPYARFGDWMVVVCALLLLWLWTTRRP
jgi:apolipoprotein N-acyltransferase